MHPYTGASVGPAAFVGGFDIFPTTAWCALLGVTMQQAPGSGLQAGRHLARADRGQLDMNHAESPPHTSVAHLLTALQLHALSC